MLNPKKHVKKRSDKVLPNVPNNLSMDLHCITYAQNSWLVCYLLSKYNLKYTAGGQLKVLFTSNQIKKHQQ